MFSRILNVRIIDIFYEILLVFLKGCKVSFEKMNSYNVIFWGILILIENFYLIGNQNKENLVKQIRRFVFSKFVKTCSEIIS